MAASYTPVFGPIDYTPDAYQIQCRLRLERNANTGVFGVKATTDGGTTWRTVFTDPFGAQTGAVPTVDENKNLVYAAPASSALKSPSAAVTVLATGAFSVDLAQVGTIYAGQTFGFYQAPANDVVCLGMQLCLQTAAVGNAATICLVQVSSNVETSQSASLASGVEYGAVTFGTPLLMPAGTQWRVRVKSIGSTTAGECLSVRFMLAPRV